MGSRLERSAARASGVVAQLSAVSRPGFSGSSSNRCSVRRVLVRGLKEAEDLLKQRRQVAVRAVPRQGACQAADEGELKTEFLEMPSFAANLSIDKPDFLRISMRRVRMASRSIPLLYFNGASICD